MSERYDGPSSDNGDMVGLTDGSSVDFGFWMIPEVSTSTEILAKLRSAPAEKARMTGWVIRPESIQSRMISGQQALSAVADYSDGDRKMVAIYTWIYTPKTHVAFIAREVPASDLVAVQSRLDQLVATAVVP